MQPYERDSLGTDVVLGRRTQATGLDEKRKPRPRQQQKGTMGSLKAVDRRLLESPKNNGSKES